MPSIQDLDGRFPIVNPDGTPTTYLLRLLNDRGDNQVETDTTLEELAGQVGGKADKTTQIIAGTGLNGGGDLSEDRTINLDPLSLDDLTDVDLTTNPPTNGQVMVYVAADDEWVPANQSGGGGGGSSWTDVSTGDLSGPTSLWRGISYYYTDEIPLSGGDVIEVRLVADRANGDNVAIAISQDDNKSVLTVRQSDDNWVLYRFDSSGGGSILLSGGSFTVNDNFTEDLYLRMTVMDVATGGTQGVFSREFRGYEKTSSVTTGQTPLTTGTPRIYVAADSGLSAIKKLQYRVNYGG